MASKIDVQIIDDLDGTPNAASRRFSVAGVDYEIDLTDDNFSRLVSSLDEFTAVARRVPSRRRTRKTTDVDLSAVREWARAHGHPIKDRGRIPGPIMEEYQRVS